MRPRHPLHGTVLVAVAVGGALGAVLRHTITAGTPDGDGFPWTTFTVNVVGTFLLAALPALAVVRRHVLLPPLLGTGVLGGFTTLSAYSEQARTLVATGAVWTAGCYVVGTVAACLLAVAVADRLSSRSARAEFEQEEGDL